VDPVPDPLLLRKSGSAGDRTRDLCICSQKLWPLDHRGGLNSITHVMYTQRDGNSPIQEKIPEILSDRGSVLHTRDTSAKWRKTGRNLFYIRKVCKQAVGSTSSANRRACVVSSKCKNTAGFAFMRHKYLSQTLRDRSWNKIKFWNLRNLWVHYEETGSTLVLFNE